MWDGCLSALLVLTLQQGSHSAHCGGDGGLMEQFAKAIDACENGGDTVDKWMFEAHKIVFAAEKARVTKQRLKLI